MKTSTARAGVIGAVLLAGFGIVMLRLFLLQIVRHQELSEKAQRYRATTRVTQSWRGRILSRRGVPLAVTRPVKNIYADLAVWEDHVGRLSRTMAPHLRTTPEWVMQQVYLRIDALKQRGKPVVGVALLKRAAAPEEWERIREAMARETFELPAQPQSGRQRRQLERFRRATLFAENDQARSYPFGETLAHVLGYVGRGTNGHLLQGRIGIEAACDPGLSGQNGLRRASRDAAGNELIFTRTRKHAVRDGASVTLTIDVKLQQIVETALARVMMKWQPSNATCVVVRPRTGEILALAGAPTFAPGSPAASPAYTRRNRVISDRHEVGSVFKVITLAAALELGVTTLDEVIDCENGKWYYNKVPLSDRGRSHGDLSVRDCLGKSSNIGLAKVAIKVGPEEFFRFIQQFGFDRVTGIALPYEVKGFVRAPADWSGISITRLAIGHELTVSQIQLAMAYAAIANEGKLMQPLLVTRVDHADGTPWTRYESRCLRRVIRPPTARRVREAMQWVVDKGTGKAARLRHHTVAGKTGTAEKSDGRRYLRGRYLCSFAGMVPAGDPELVIAVAVDEPRGKVSGGAVAAPVFREIAEQAVELYNIPPDKSLSLRRVPRSDQRAPYLSASW